MAFTSLRHTVRMLLLLVLLCCAGTGRTIAQITLKTPQNLREVVEYDWKSGNYYIYTRLGNTNIGVPRILTREEYLELTLKQSMADYYRGRNDSLVGKSGKDPFDFMDMKFNLGPAEKLFGKGGVQIKMQGNAELSFGVNYKNVQNPSLPESQRKTIGFDFDEKINVGITGKVGDKVNLNMNYNTDATFDFDTKQLKLKYEGKEDEIVKLIEAGNVSMPTQNSLIRGATSLFGLRTDLQFGKLSVQTVISQQESESHSVSTKGGAQTTSFDFSADQYDENRHFFLAHYFHDTYDRNMEQLPNILSGITIHRIEVWVTNKRGNYESPRNLVALADLAEGAQTAPSNAAGPLYQLMTTAYAGARDISQVTTVMTGAGMESGMDYEKIENARLLTSSEYRLNAALGYLSLKQALQPDEVLAVAFEYTLGGRNYQVGEFASDIKDTSQSLFVKLLKNTANSPGSSVWDLMMKNVYSLNAYALQREKFQLNITYLSDTTGVYLRYLPEGKTAKIPLVRVMNLDRLNSTGQPGADGFFDFVEGYTVSATDGRIFFPVVEPFGSHLRKMIGDDNLADKYLFQELYDSTRTVARQLAEKNKYRLTGEFRASNANEIRLNAMNVPPGSVHVTAGGVTLVENSDYTVDYTLGVVTILNQSIIDAGTAVNVSLESNTQFGMQRKTMLGLNFAYDFSPDFSIGGSIMRLSEKPLTSKVAMGDEPISNTLWGLNASWKTQSQWLTNLLDKLPFVHATAPSSINLGVEFAHLIPGHADGLQQDASYIDDFESTRSGIDLRQPSYWMLASTPFNSSASSLFPEASLSGNVEYGKNRALLAWYFIDGLFTRRSSSLTPSHIKNDLEQLSNHYVREVYEQELFPNKETSYQESSLINVLNLAYYPQERGPYNLDTDLNTDGTLRTPQKRWGGMMRKLETSDFETANIEYVEFWLLDPYIYQEAAGQHPAGGELYLNLGELSEDILKDGKKFFENGLPADGDMSRLEETVWGRVPRDRSVVYAFDNTAGARRRQDVGLNGLSSEEERTFPAYATYLAELQQRLDAATFARYENDPAGDNYHYFRGSDYDEQQLSILERYKYYNNTEGNSTAAEDSPERYDISSKTVPDVEDINQDNTLNESEKYFQYKISLRPGDLQIGRNYVTDKRTASVRLRNGKTEEVNWYQFKVPVRSGEAVGNIKDFKSIRFMRLFLTGFEEPVVLRFATFELVRGEWRTYTDLLGNTQQGGASATQAKLDVSAVNIEENGDRTPVNYVMPPGISRVIDPGQPQLRQQNEQAMSLKLTHLPPGDARAVYKSTSMDMRQYKRIQMFAHGEAFPDNSTAPQDGELSVFIRIGSDYRNNYYEYEIPLVLTPAGQYNSSSEAGSLAVWPQANNLDILLSLLTTLKKNRNRLIGVAGSGVSYSRLYSEYDPAHPANKASVMGNPTLAEAKTLMIGVRNNARTSKSAEVWVNELRLSDFDEAGGWAAQGNLNMQLSDLGSFNLGGHIETAGFGGLEQSVSERRLDDYYQYALTTTFDVGRFLPARLKLSAPLYYSYSKEATTPQYNPLDTDMRLDDALDALHSREERDSLMTIARTISTYRNFSISNLRFNVSSKKPMPYDPANFSVSYSNSLRHNQGSTTMYEDELDWRAALSYQYAPLYKAWEPFKKMKSKSPWAQLLKDFSFNWLPQSVAINSELARHYYELQLRDLDSPEESVAIDPSVAKSYLWNRDFALRWDFTKNLRVNFSSVTHAQIEEPYGVVNKERYPDQYEAWKDSVRRSLLSLGSPIAYQQSFNATYKLPFEKIPLTDWLTADVRFASSYNWDRGVALTDGAQMGNTISNQRALDVNGRLNLESLYNKLPYLKEVNRRFSATYRKPAAPKKNRRFEKSVTLLPDTTLTLTHNLATKRPILTARRANGQLYPLKIKRTNANSLIILNRDTARLKITVVAGKPREDSWLYKVGQHAARLAMSVRNAGITYKKSYAMTLPGFRPDVGDLFGQKRNGGVWAPGLDFAFGLTDDHYIETARARGWLIANDSVATPASSNALEDLQVRMTVEPLRDLKIELTASRTRNQSRQIHYMFEGNDSRNGNFTMSILSLGSAFEGKRAADGYHSRVFERFRASLPAVRDRVEGRFLGTSYPQGSTLAGMPFDPSRGTVSPYAPEVMVPAFLAAYTGRDAARTGLDFFPGILSMMPNWRITYNGLGRMAWAKNLFRSINLNHAYRSTYTIGSYQSYQSFMPSTGDWGFIEDVQTGNPLPSSRFEVG
ncbi:MAG: cell surface protein SprA, partial [Prevotellaceae bacterium]|nr:cell surface protein SprA [Prevotellaceae bacterium]